MNAPTSPAAIAEPQIELIPCAALAPSETHIQKLRRKRYDMDLGRAAVEKFNEVSERVGFPDRIAVASETQPNNEGYPARYYTCRTKRSRV